MSDARRIFESPSITIIANQGKFVSPVDLYQASLFITSTIDSIDPNHVCNSKENVVSPDEI